MRNLFPNVVSASSRHSAPSFSMLSRKLRRCGACVAESKDGQSYVQACAPPPRYGEFISNFFNPGYHFAVTVEKGLKGSIFEGHSQHSHSIESYLFYSSIIMAYAQWVTIIIHNVGNGKCKIKNLGLSWGKLYADGKVALPLVVLR
jgi:hypothetical protein